MQKRAVFSLLILFALIPCTAKAQSAPESAASRPPPESEPADAALPEDATSQADTLLPADAALPAPFYLTQLWSLDFMLLACELTSGGIGFGVQYERQLFPHLALKGYFGHATMNTKYRDYYCVTVSFGAFAEWYPLSRELTKLYAAAGSYFDYLSYISKKEDIDDLSGNVLSFIPQLGYKLELPHNWLIDIHAEYKLPYKTEVEAYGRAESYIKRGLQYGVSVKHVLR